MRRVTVAMTEEDHAHLVALAGRRGMKPGAMVAELAARAVREAEVAPRYSMGVGTWVQVFLPGTEDFKP